MPTRAGDKAQSIKTPIDKEQVVEITIPFEQQRLETINTLAKSVYELAKGLNITPLVTISNCVFNPAKEQKAPTISIQ